MHDRVRLNRDQAELLVLAVLGGGPGYGYGIAKAVAVRSGGQVRLGASALYPLLERMERAGFVQTEWEEVKAAASAPDASGRRRKWYRLSPRGEERLRARLDQHQRVQGMLERFLGTGPADAGQGVGP
jgi:DNA-binding PadR family transcriptional regulator